ncbi:MAG: hypothetical protein RSF81_05530 [Oscillospiraceae bacterium]
MLNNKIKKYIKFSSMIIFVLSSIALAIFNYSQLNDVVFYKNKDAIISGSIANKDNAFLILQNKNSNTNKLRSFKTFLKQNDFSFVSVILDENGINQEINDEIDKVFSDNELNKTFYLATQGKIENSLIVDNASYKLNGKIIFEPNKEQENADKETPILLITTTLSNQSPPELATEIYNKMTSQTINSTGFAFNSNNGNVTLNIVSQMHKSYKPMSYEMVELVQKWINDNFSLNLKYQNFYQFTDVLIYVNLISLAIVFILTNWYNTFKKMEQTYRIIDLVVVSPIKFLFARVFVWIISLLILAVLSFIAWNIKTIQFDSSLVFALYLFASGIVMSALYKFGKAPGINGNIDNKSAIPVGKLAYGKSIVLILPFLLTFILVDMSGYLYVDYTLKSIITSVAFMFMIYPGFYIFERENAILNEIEVRTVTRNLYKIALFVPLLIIALICIPIGYTTWLYTSYVQIIALVLVILLGNAIKDITDSIFFSSTIQAILYGVFLGAVKLV